MLTEHASLILAQLRDEDVVLDVGAWASPFNRAQWILDAQPYETRGFYRTFGGPASQGGDREWFTAKTWVQRDICEHHPWPFEDRQFDFVICSHTLEDVRDPLWVCSELMRVGKRGYIEVPSRAYESTMGKERHGMAGLSHHRWLIEITGSHIEFQLKSHMIHTSRRFHLPAGFSAPAFQWLWWDDRFTVAESVIHGVRAQEAELERFVGAPAPRPAWRRFRRSGGGGDAREPAASRVAESDSRVFTGPASAGQRPESQVAPGLVFGNHRYRRRKIERRTLHVD